MASCQPAPADCSEELLRDGIPNDTAAAIATNCFDLIYFSFLQPPPHTHPPPPHYPQPTPSSPPCHRYSSFSSFTQLPFKHSVSLSVFLALNFLCCRLNTISFLFNTMPVAGSICLEVPLPHRVRVRQGRSLHCPVWKRPLGRAGQDLLRCEGVQPETCPRVCPAFSAFCHLYVCMQHFAGVGEGFVGQRAPRHQKQAMCPLFFSCFLTLFVPSLSFRLLFKTYCLFLRLLAGALPARSHPCAQPLFDQF